MVAGGERPRDLENNRQPGSGHFRAKYLHAERAAGAEELNGNFLRSSEGLFCAHLWLWPLRFCRWRRTRVRPLRRWKRLWPLQSTDKDDLLSSVLAWTHTHSWPLLFSASRAKLRVKATKCGGGPMMLGPCVARMPRSRLEVGQMPPEVPSERRADTEPASASLLHAVLAPRKSQDKL